MNTALVSLSDMEKMAVAIAKSNLFGVKTPEQALTLMLISQAEGRHPALAARDYDLIQGRPSKKSEAMLRDFLEGGGSVQWHKLDDTIADATFSHPQGGTVQITWDMKRAKDAGLGGKDMWRKYPRQMLRARTVSEGIRTVCPMATSGMYVPEEVQDFGREKDITPMAGAGESLTPEDQLKVNEVVAKVVEWMNSGSVADACQEIENAGFNADEMIYMWSHLDSKMRSAIKKERARQRLAPPEPVAQPESSTTDLLVSEEPKSPAAIAATISEAARKRLEARITELGLDRDMVKKYASDVFKVEHFADLSRENYDALDNHLEIMATDQAPKPELITPDEAMKLEARCTDNDIKPAKVKAFFKVQRFAQMTAQQLADAHAMIDDTIAARKDKAA